MSITSTWDYVEYLFVDKDGDCIMVYSSEDDDFEPRSFWRDNYDSTHAWERAAEAFAAVRAHDYGCNY